MADLRRFYHPDGDLVVNCDKVEVARIKEDEIVIHFSGGRKQVVSATEENAARLAGGWPGWEGTHSLYTSNLFPEPKEVEVSVVPGTTVCEDE